MPIIFPSNPIDGQTFVVGQRAWKFDATIGVWSIVTEFAPAVAGAIEYDNQTSGLAAENIQAAIDEVVVDLGNKLVEADLVDLNSDLIPSTTETYDLGSETNKWKELYLSGNTIFLGSIKLEDDEGKLAIVDSENNALALDEFEPTIEPTTAADYYRGDKIFQPLNAAAVGLENVTNESKATMFTDAALTGIPTAPTPAQAANTTQIATAEFVTSEISALALGLNRSFVVADIAERDALTTLNLGDFVFVADNGDDKWAQYKLVNDDPKTFVKIMDQDIMLNALNAPDIKAAYESNADTNAFTDAEQTKLATTDVFDETGTYAGLRAQATTKEDVGLNNVDNVKQAVVAFYPVEIAVEDWTGSEPAIATKTVNGITSTDIASVDIDLSDVNFADIEEQQDNWALVYRAEGQTDAVKFYATETPDVTLKVQIKVVK